MVRNSSLIRICSAILGQISSFKTVDSHRYACPSEQTTLKPTNSNKLRMINDGSIDKVVSGAVIKLPVFLHFEWCSTHPYEQSRRSPECPGQFPAYQRITLVSRPRKGPGTSDLPLLRFNTEPPMEHTDGSPCTTRATRYDSVIALSDPDQVIPWAKADVGTNSPSLESTIQDHAVSTSNGMTGHWWIQVAAANAIMTPKEDMTGNLLENYSIALGYRLQPA